MCLQVPRPLWWKSGVVEKKREIDDFHKISVSGIRGSHLKGRMDFFGWVEVPNRGWVFECPDLSACDLLFIRAAPVLLFGQG